MKALILLSLISISMPALSADKVMDLLALRWARSQSQTESTPINDYLKKVEANYAEMLGTRVGGHVTGNIKVLPIDVEFIGRTYCSNSETETGKINCYGENDIVKYIVSVPYRHTFSGGIGSYSTLFSVIVDKRLNWSEDTDGNKTNIRETIEYRYKEEIR